MDTQARRPSLASVVGTRERERREIPHDVSSDPARQRLHFDPAKPCLGRAGRECPGSRRLRLEADVGDVPGRVPVRRCDRESRIPGSSRIIPAYPGLKLLIDLTVRAPCNSDDLAALATGGGLSKRALYTDMEESTLNAQRPILLNGIGGVVTRADQLDRSLVLTLPVIQDEHRQEESTFWAAFDRARPAILGALLDAVVMALRNHGSVHLPSKPRMADFAVWAVAAEPVCPWPEGTFLTAYEGHKQDAIEAMLDGHPVGDVVRALAPWTGTAKDLLAELNKRTPEATTTQKSWFSTLAPRSPTRL